MVSTLPRCVTACEIRSKQWYFHCVNKSWCMRRNGSVLHSRYVVFNFWWYSLETHCFIWYSFKISDTPAFACGDWMKTGCKTAIAEIWHFSDPETIYFMRKSSMYFHCSNYSFDIVLDLEMMRHFHNLQMTRKQIWSSWSFGCLCPLIKALRVLDNVFSFFYSQINFSFCSPTNWVTWTFSMACFHIILRGGVYS